MSDAAGIRQSIDQYLIWMSRICGAISVFSLLNRAFNFGIADALAPLIAAWQIVVSYTLGWLLKFFGLPPIWGDFFVLSTITIFIFYRGALRLGVKPIRMGYEGIKRMYVAHALLRFDARLRKIEVLSPFTIQTPDHYEKANVDRRRYEELTADERKQLRPLTDFEIEWLVQAQEPTITQEVDENTTKALGMALLAIPIIFGALVVSALALQLVGPFVDQANNYDYNILVMALQATLYIPVLAYFFFPVLEWISFLSMYLYHTCKKIDPLSTALGYFPRLVFYETALLTGAVAIFFVTNAGFSLF